MGVETLKEENTFDDNLIQKIGNLIRTENLKEREYLDHKLAEQKTYFTTYIDTEITKVKAINETKIKELDIS